MELSAFLGSKAPLVNKTLSGIKDLARKKGKRDTKSTAGGVGYFLLRYAFGKPFADKFWHLLDSDAGLSVDSENDRFGRRVWDALRGDHPTLDKVRAAALFVELLAKTRQLKKARSVEKALERLLSSEIAEAQTLATGTPGKSAKPLDIFMEEVEGAEAAAKWVLGFTKDPSEIGDFILAVLEDVNGRREAKVLAGIMPSSGSLSEPLVERVSEASRIVDYDPLSASALAAALFLLIGKKPIAAKIARAMIKLDPNTYDPHRLAKESSMSLRNTVIRLAGSKPALRKHLVPLLREAYEKTSFRGVPRNLTKIIIGNRARLRWAGPSGSGRDAQTIIVEELPGRPHKAKLRRLIYTGDWNVYQEHQSRFLAVNIMADARITKSMNYDQMASALQAAIEDAGVSMPGFRLSDVLYERVVHFLEVEPTDYRPLDVTLRDGSRIEAAWSHFEVWSKSSTMNYEPDGDPHYTRLVSKSKGAARNFYKMLRADVGRFQSMDWDSLKKFLGAAKIGYEYEFSQWT